ncbi:MAG TPA: Hpt domain-containing protein [Rhodocyclaceae bacterium]|nr:Hpt domain-containing protein [Rhodocyclaceae bacterium]HMZ83072.1 Hpt domain-containing protein [Rhodocyclaceae bacterium]HNA02695.1 Hpt domain-containing protein [Rhodocyclaceae bacterium]HNB77780.1 Hpt domain-containing protein [Rhodocyclaceae bacterium]HNC62445.1 Hpt domain-containing protein [Rhodocyclaceae bacterium]
MPARLRELAACGDYAQIAFVAHTIKGVAGNLMARPAESLARETEAAARGSSPEALQLAMRLAEAIETMFAATRARFPGIETAAAQTVGG